VYCSLKSQKKFTKNPYFGGSRSFKVIDVGTYVKVTPLGSKVIGAHASSDKVDLGSLEMRQINSGVSGPKFTFSLRTPERSWFITPFSDC